MSKSKLPLAEAIKLADEILFALRPFCERIEVAGSIRRKCAEVGDIEIVCIPQTTPIKNLFGEVTSVENQINAAVDMLADILSITKNGERYKQFSFQGRQVDLFLTTAEQWGVIFAIRTGPAEFSQKIVTQKSKGGYLNDNALVRDGWLNLWNEDPGVFEAVPVADEDEFFAFTTLHTPPAPEQRK